MRATATLTAKLERNLLAYASAAAAAGVSILASAEPSAAKIVYTQTHEVIDYGNSYHLDLNNDGNAEFLLYVTGTCFSYCYNSLKVSGMNSVDSMAVGNPPWFALALLRGAKIDSQLRFTNHAVMAGVELFTHRTLPFGPWVNVKNRYLGLKFQINGETNYGWARLSVDVEGSDITGTLTGYAYETIPDKPIIAGNRGSTTGQGPEAQIGPVSLGHLALGAAGRKKHTQATPFPAPN